MKILFLTDNFPPEVNAPATRTYEHCLEWVKLGAEVTVITCFPNFPVGKVYDGFENKLYAIEKKDGIKIIRVWSYIAPNKGFFKRILDYCSYAIMAILQGLFVKSDIIIATSPQFFTAIAGRVLSFLKRKPGVLEIRDLWPESIAAVGMMKQSSSSYKALKSIERYLYRKASIIVTVTDSFKEYINKMSIKNEKIHVIKNGVSLPNFQKTPKDDQLLKELHLQNKYIIGYIGTHGLSHGLDFVLDCAKTLKNDDIIFLFIGGGAEKENLEKIKREEELTNVVMLPFQTKDKIARYISILDVSLVNLKKSDTFKTVIPSKIFENASMGKPILLGVEGEAKLLIEKYNAGLAFEPENKQDFLRKLKEIRHPEKYSELVKGCDKLAFEFDRKVLAKNMYAVLETIHHENKS